MPCPAGSSSSGGGACAPCPANQSSLAGGPCAPCPAGQSALPGGPCTRTPCSQLFNGDFADGLSGWTVLKDAGGTYGGFKLSTCYVSESNPRATCIIDSTGIDFPSGAYALVSSAHTVLPGEALVVNISIAPMGFTVDSPDTMHFLPYPPGPARSQARLDVYSASSPAFPSAASLQASVFNATDIEAAPYAGNLFGIVGFLNLRHGPLAPVTFSLAPYVGRTVYFAYRSSNNYPAAYSPVALANFTISC